MEAGGNAHVRAFGASIVRARGGATIDALDHVSVTVHGTTPTVNGGNVTRAPAPQTAEEWCDLYGVEVKTASRRSTRRSTASSTPTTA